MAKLPRVTATTAARGSGAVRADVSAMTQDTQALAQMGRAIGQTSDLMFKVKDRNLELDANIQYGIVTKNVDAFIADQEQRMSETEVSSYDQREQILNDYRKEFDSFLNEQMGSVDSKRAKKRLEQWKDMNTVEINGQQRFIPFQRVRSKGILRLKEYQTGSLIELANAAAKNGDIDTANEYLDEIDKSELKSKEWIVREKERIKSVHEQSVENMIKAGFEQEVVGIANQEGKTWDDAIEWASSPEAIKAITDRGLSTEKARTVVSSVVAFASQQKNIQEAEEKKQIKLSEESRDKTVIDGYSQIATNPEEYDLQANTLAIMADESMSPADRIDAVDRIERQYAEWHQTDSETPEISDSGAQRAMEKMSSDLANRRITKTEYYQEFAKHKGKLDETDRRRFVKEGETSYAAGVNAIKDAYQNRARNQIVTVTDEKMEAMQRDVDSKIKMTYMLDSAGAKQQAQQLIYNDYVQDVMDLFEQEGYGEKPQKEIEADIKSIYARHSAKSWMDVYETLTAQNTNFQRVIKSTANEYNVYMEQKYGAKDAWKNTDSVQQAKIIDLASRGMTMTTILRMAEERQF